MKFLEIATKIKDILIENTQIMQELNSPDSIFVFSNEAPVDPSQYPLVFIHMPETIENNVRGAGDGRSLFILKWFFEIGIYVYVDIEQQVIDYSGLNYLIRLIFNTVYNSSVFDEDEVDGTALFNIEMVGFQPDKEIMKPLIGGILQFYIHEGYNTNETVTKT
jgi:hypothetical protein